MGKIIPKHARVWLVLCALTQFLAYYVPRLLPSRGYIVDMTTPLDKMITVDPFWVTIYVATYFFWIWGYIYICRTSRADCRTFFRADIINKVVSALCFILLPTHLPRVTELGKGPFEWMLSIVYALDQPDNLFPSMHVSVSWLVARYMGSMRGVRPTIKVFSYVFAVLVFLSTLFTGQHVVADIAGGMLTAEVALFISRRIVKRKSGAES